MLKARQTYMILPVNWLTYNQAGLRVFATARRMETMKELEVLGIETLHLEVTSEESIVSLHDEISKRTGGTLDILVNNA